MCLYVKRTRFQRILNFLVFPKIAKEDIIVYKIYQLSKNGRYMSIHQESYHDKGTQFKVRLGITFNYWDFEVHEGYHSFIDKPSQEDLYYGYCIVRCIIPKGAKYFKGGINSTYITNGYVSDSLIIVGEV